MLWNVNYLLTQHREVRRKKKISLFIVRQMKKWAEIKENTERIPKNEMDFEIMKLLIKGISLFFIISLLFVFLPLREIIFYCMPFYIPILTNIKWEKTILNDDLSKFPTSNVCPRSLFHFQIIVSSYINIDRTYRPYSLV